MQENKNNNLKKPRSKIVTDDMIILLKAKDAALLCGVTLRTWWSWDIMGYTPQSIMIGRAKFWRYKELEQWIDAGCPRRDVWHYRDKSKK